MGDLFSNMPVLRSAAEMAQHICDVIRNFDDPDDKRTTAEELIDRAERRGAISAETARALEAVFLSPAE
ncbi:hypothetical protein [Methylobacterium radiotolerans]|uniref:hypothetical protein n=1 Tax=Methylobacterium radiotolerans TaxID=31998 RepID=UPI0038D12DE5